MARDAASWHRAALASALEAIEWQAVSASARIWLTDERAISFHVSLLGPYYGIHLTGAPDEEPVASEIAREIEATSRGYQTIPPELGNEVVPDVGTVEAILGEVTIYVCPLFGRLDLGGLTMRQRGAAVRLVAGIRQNN